MKIALPALLALTSLPLLARAAPAANPAPDLANVRYGPYARNFLDFWRAKSDRPTPLFIHIHGGGWLAGDKANFVHDTQTLVPDLLPFLLAHGVSVAAINYRYSSMAPLPAPVYDAVRAVQFLRHQAAAWHLDPARFAAEGTSAGGCTTLWLAYHSDMANPDSADPVARESSRLRVAVVFSPQTSIDPKVIVGWVGDQIMNHPMIARSVGAKDRVEAMARYGEWSSLYREFSPINHVGPGAPPVLMSYPTYSPLPAATPGLAIHHARLGLELKKKADAAGDICIEEIRDRLKPGQPAPADFLLQHLTGP